MNECGYHYAITQLWNYLSGTHHALWTLCAPVPALPACPCGAHRGLSRMNSPQAGASHIPLAQHMQKTQSCHWEPSTAHLVPSFFFFFLVQRPCVNTSFNQLFQDRCASLASEQCNYFPSSPLSKSRGFIGLLMVWFVVGRNKKDSNSLIILSYRYPAE